MFAKRRPQLRVALVSVLGLFLFLGSRGLNEPDEGRFAEAAREMLVQSDMLIPHLGGVPHLQKPPMIYWLTAASLRVLGVNEWAARLPSALAALGTILLIMHLAGLLFDRNVAWLSGLILLSNGLFFAMARTITTDMLLCFWITASVVCFVDYTVKNRTWAIALFYLCLGLGFLTKGPIAFLIPLCAVIPWAIARQRQPGHDRRTYYGFPGFLVALVIGFSWFIVLFQQHPELMTYYLHYEFLDRIASNVHNRAKPFWFYSAVLLGGLFPWSVLLPRTLRFIMGTRPGIGSPVRWLFAGWLILPWFILHGVTSKLPTYLLPLYPPLAVVLAYSVQCSKKHWFSELNIACVLMATLLAALPAAAWYTSSTDGSVLSFSFGLVVPSIAFCLLWITLMLRSSAAQNDAPRWHVIGGLMLASLLFMIYQADRFIVPRDKTMTAIVASIREAKHLFPDAKIFELNQKKYSLDFYLQEPMYRSSEIVEKTLPLPDAYQPFYVEDIPAFLDKMIAHDLIIVTSKSTLTNDYTATWQTFSMHRRMAVMVRPGQK